MPSEPERIQFIADRGDARLRLDQVVVRRVSDISRLSRSVAQRWIETGAVTVDGRAARRAAARVREGSTVEVALPDSAVRRVRPAAEPVDLDIIDQDDAFMIVNKPAGVVVHPSYKQITGTLLSGVLWRTRDRAGVQPGIVTRLDKGTSGLVIVALTPSVHAALQRASAAGRIRKEYLAVVSASPTPPVGRITLPLARDPGDRRRVVTMAGGAPSETRYEVIASHRDEHGPLSLVRCELVTGRTHQIRVHLAASGWPIAGDPLYGTPHPAIARQALHAWRVSMPHPITNEPLVFAAPLPPDMAHLLPVPA